jgi:N-acetylneuraminic acid mutarotase
MGAVGWTDAAGNFWLFGGSGIDSAGTDYYLNDLWKYSAGQWTWMGGSNAVDKMGTYGTEGTAAAGNVPGARMGAVGWTDGAGNFWLFGGQGYDSAGTRGFLNDLWKYSAGRWTWMGGSKVVAHQGTYGTEGTAAAGNVPGARMGAVGWTDAAGNFWLFGGFGYNSAGEFGLLNDLWKYSGGQWTWMGGLNAADQKGRYGTQGTAAAGNVPGARHAAAGWTDAAGNFWLFGGNGFDSAGTPGLLNDLWKYEP